MEITASNWTKIERELKTLKKRMKKKGGLQPSWTVKDAGVREIREFGILLGTEDVFEVEIDSMNACVNGWSLIAAIDHTSAGNIVRRIPEYAELDIESFRTNASRCDHCNLKRVRNTTFIFVQLHPFTLEPQPINLIQVGRTCLQDFFGKDPEQFFYIRNVLALLERELGDEARDERRMRAPQRWDLLGYLSYVGLIISQAGWVSRKKATEDQIPTTDLVNMVMWDRDGWKRLANYLNVDEFKLFKDPGRFFEDAKAAAEWAVNLTPSTDWGHNVQIIAKAGHFAPKHASYVASIFPIYMDFKEKDRVRKLESKRYEHDPTLSIGTKIERELNVVYSRAMPPSRWGEGYLYKFEEGDHSYSWFASRNQNLEVGDRVHLKGTVKKMDEYKGRKQHQLTRCKVTQIQDTPISKVDDEESAVNAIRIETKDLDLA